jgi:glycosyltransferase involved in cell wall biosynthesis
MGLKVLMIGAYPLEPGMVHGGIESATSTLVPALAARDDIECVTVLRFHRGEAVTEFRREGPKVEVHYVRGQGRFRTITGSVLDVQKARKLIAQVKPDVVHGQEIACFGDIASKCSPNSVVTVHGMPHVEIVLSARNSFHDRVRIHPINRMVMRVLRRAKVVISISDYDSKELDSLTRGARVSIPNATATEFFSLKPPVSTAPRLLMAGVLTPRKNPLGLVNAFADVRKAVPEARLALIGPQSDPAYVRTVRGRVAALGLDDSVEILDAVDNERLGREIAAARAVVLFSRQETAPTIIAQAMAAGKPVVATRVGGVPEMVDDGETGYLVDSEDEVALADRLQTLLKDQDLCLQMGSRARDFAVRRYMPDAVAEKTVQAYRLAIRSGDGTRSAAGVHSLAQP